MTFWFEVILLALLWIVLELSQAAIRQTLKHRELSRQERSHNRQMAIRLRLLHNAIRHHRDQTGDNRCWLDDYDLYALLPEGLNGVDLKCLTREQMLKGCHQYVDCRLVTETPEQALILYKQIKGNSEESSRSDGQAV